MSTTPFDQVMKTIRQVGYHNHRQPVHSDMSVRESFKTYSEAAIR